MANNDELIAKIRATLFESAYVLFNDPEDNTRAEKTLIELFALFGIDEFSSALMRKETRLTRKIPRMCTGRKTIYGTKR
jgi:hypothetical protein